LSVSAIFYLWNNIARIMKLKNFTLNLPGMAFLLLILCGSVQANSESLGQGAGNAAPKTPAHRLENLVQYVNPFCGTTHDGGLYPGVSAPFGMVQWSPDTGRRPTLGGYDYRDSTINGFSLDHLSGGGSIYAGNFGFMPLSSSEGLTAVPSSRYAFNTTFSHRNEVARPGYYAVTLDNGIKVELTATTRSGFGCFTYPAKGAGAMVINAGSNANGTSNAAVQIDPAAHSITGSATGGHFLGHPNACTTYFYAVFDRPFASCGTWSDSTLLKGRTNGQGKTAGAYVMFNTENSRTILARVAISYVSIENAKANLEAENPLPVFSAKGFEKAVDAAGAAWNSWLNKIQLTGGTAGELRTFYSMFYHTLLGPTVCSDANGEYMGYDGRVHTTTDGRAQYGNFSGWDIYRSECQFLAMIAPKEASDMAQSLLLDYQQGGAFPRWGLATEDSGVMDGDPAAPIIAGFHAFGARDFDVKHALAGLVRAATNPLVMATRSRIFERDALADYLKLGYVPEDQHGIWGAYGNVSMTLEYASADFAVSQLAQALGDTTNSALLLKQAQNWTNLYNHETGYLQMRRRDGTWAPGFTNNVLAYDQNRAYQEGTASQYVWMVPFNLKALVEAMGGRDAAAARLDSFFTQLNAGAGSPFAYMGNEPCLETPWIYSFLGRPYKTQQIVRRILTELYSSEPAGYPGNDDLGEMSSWYVFAALGMYPELPGSDVLVLGSPLFPKTRLHLKHGDVTIEANGAKEDAPFVQSLAVNGRQWNKPWIRFRDISNGAILKYNLARVPDKNWGSAPDNAPPSLGASE
jgi:predicted alpha-1,2-mannosidase